MRREMERRSDVVVESNEICPITQSVEATKQHEDKSMGEKMKDAIKSMIPDALKKDHSSSGNPP